MGYYNFYVNTVYICKTHTYQTFVFCIFILCIYFYKSCYMYVISIKHLIVEHHCSIIVLVSAVKPERDSASLKRKIKSQINHQ